MSNTTTGTEHALPEQALPEQALPEQELAHRIRAARTRRTRSQSARLGLLALASVAAVAAGLMLGHTVYGPSAVWRVVLSQLGLGGTVPGASFTVGELRMPRVALGLLTGAAFGMGGCVFQTMLRNPLASPDIIGITSGASAAAVFSLTALHLDPSVVPLVAIVAGLATATAIYLLAFKDGLVGTRLILIGIGISAMLHALTTWFTSRASIWDVQGAMRWLSGSLNAASWTQIVPLGVALLALGGVLLGQSRSLDRMRLGDDLAHGLGIRVERTRLVTILAAVTLVAFATAAAGPIAFVAFLAGPIASRIVGPCGPVLPAAALVGSLLVLLSDLAAQYAFGSRLPVGVVTGVLGAPYLIHLLVRTNRQGGSL